MKTAAEDSDQTMQRVKVGLTGLALVLLLIAIASAIGRSASDEKPLDVAGAGKPEVVANISTPTDDSAAAPQSSEPLVELGVTPDTTASGNDAGTTNTVAPAPAPTVAAPPTRR